MSTTDHEAIATEWAVEDALKTIRSIANDYPRLVVYLTDNAKRFEKLPRQMKSQEAAAINLLREFVGIQVSFLYLLHQSSETEDTEDSETGERGWTLQQGPENGRERT